MTLKKQNPWKLLSIGLLGVIAIGLLTPIDAAPPPGNREVEATEVGCDNPCIDETELTFDTATQAELDATNTAGGILEGTVAGLILDLATETAARIAGDGSLNAAIGTEKVARILADLDEKDRAQAAENAIQEDVDTILDQFCSPGNVVTGISTGGTITCTDNKAGVTHKTYIIKTPLFVVSPDAPNNFLVKSMQCLNVDDIALAGGWDSLDPEEMVIQNFVPMESGSGFDGIGWNFSVHNIASGDEDIRFWLKCLDLDGDFNSASYPRPNGTVLHWESP